MRNLEPYGGDIERNYLQRIAQNPNDLDLHNDYAHFLNICGYSRGDTIIRAVSARSMGEYTHARRYEWTRAHSDAAQAWQRHETKWVEPLAQFGIRSVGARLGVPASVTMELGDFLDKGAGLLHMHPQLIIRLHAKDKARIGELATCEHLSTLTGLHIQCCPHAADMIAALAQNPHLGTIRELTLSNNALTDAQLAPLLAPESSLRAVETFDIRGNKLTDDTTRILATSPYFAKLRDVNLIGNAATRLTRVNYSHSDAIAQELASAPVAQVG